MQGGCTLKDQTLKMTRTLLFPDTQWKERDSQNPFTIGTFACVMAKLLFLAAELRIFSEDLGLQSGPPATELGKPESPRSASESAGNSPRKKGDCWGELLEAALGGRFLWRSRETALLPAISPAIPFILALFPALLGYSGSLSPATNGPDCNLEVWQGNST